MSFLATVPEIYINNTNIHNNTQHGVYLENPRHYAFVNASVLSHNGYGAGLRVYGGAADIHINDSYLEYNQDNGVNITYDGGYRIFNESHFNFNYGNGINITFNETTIDNRTRLAKQQRTEIFKSEFIGNDGIGVRVGNFCRSVESHRLGDFCVYNRECRGHKAVVNQSHFEDNRGDALEFESCYIKMNVSTELTNYTAGYNVFKRNFGHGIKIQPLLNAVGNIRFNHFTEHPRHALLIDNGENFLETKLWSAMEVVYEISNNTFRENKGYYVVNLRLTQGSQAQTLLFIHNILTSNVIEGSSNNLNERTRAYAVVILSSSNVNVIRNFLVNDGSRYELATHLRDRSIQLKCALQWWDTTEYDFIIMKIFDQSNRYDLAYLKYHPVLMQPDLQWHATTHENLEKEVAFLRPGNRLGGRLPWFRERGIKTLEFRTDPITYIVDRDITILPEGHLIITPGTTFEFENSIGMLVQGFLEASGRENEKIMFTLKNDTSGGEHPLVRLVAGANEYEGRVEIRMDTNNESEWGTICNKVS